MAEMITYKDEHWYKVGDQYFPSVTSMLSITSKPGLDRWRGDIGNREADLKIWESQRRGSRIHEAWEHIQNGGVVTFDPKKTNILENGVLNLRYQDEMIDLWKLERFYNILNPKIISVEFIVYSLKSMYAGTVDSLWWINGGEYEGIVRGKLKLEAGYYIVDLKTGKTVGRDAELQMSAYKKAYNEMIPGTKINGAIILHTGSKTTSGIDGFGCYIYDEKKLDKDYEEFAVIRDLYERRNVGRGPMVFSFPNSIKLKTV